MSFLQLWENIIKINTKQPSPPKLGKYLKIIKTRIHEKEKEIMEIENFAIKNFYKQEKFYR